MPQHVRCARAGGMSMQRADRELDCARLREEGFDSPRLDYTDPDSIITALADVLEDTGGMLDAVFNNGAHITPGAVEDVPTEALREIFEANFLAGTRSRAPSSP